MKKLFTMASIAIVFASCQNQSKQLAPNEIDYAIYDGTPVTHSEDLEPVYIPISLLGLYQLGDTVWVNDKNIIEPMPLRDAETKQPVTSGLERMVLGLRLGHNTRAEYGKQPKYINAD